MIRHAFVLALAGGIATVSGQVPMPPSFEVASVKLNTSNKPPLTQAHLDFLRFVATDSSRNGRFTMEGFGAVPVTVLIQVAYNVKDFQVSGGPSWTRSERYDVSARAEGPATFEQMRPMLQSLLADRFRLTLRREAKEMPLYELAPAEGGLQISAVKEGGCVPRDDAAPKPLAPLDTCGGVRRQATPEGQVLEAVGISMATLTHLLSDSVGRVVVDKTGFTPLFSFRLRFANRATDPSAPSLFDALEEQLGLRLRSVNRHVDVLTIDRIERPSPN